MALTSGPARLPERPVLLVLGQWHGGGAEEVARGWLSAWRQSGLAVGIVFATPGAVGRSGIEDDQVVALARRTSEGLASFVLRLRHLLKGRPEVAVVSVLTWQNLLTLCATVGLKNEVVISEHNLPSVMLRGAGMRRSMQRALCYLLYHRANMAIGVSHAVATDLRTNYRVQPARTWVMPNVIQVMGASAGRLPSESRVQPGTGIRLLVPGRLVAQKRPHFALNVASHLGDGCEVVYVGDGPLQADLSRHARSAGVSVRLEPWREDWAEWARLECSGTPVVFLGSDVEGFGNVLVQATARQLPTVAPATALGVGDAVIPGMTGYLYNAMDPEDAATAVRAAARLDSDTYVSVWLHQFGVDAVADQWRRLFRAVSAATADTAP